MKIDVREKLQKRDDIEARLARHKTVTYVTLTALAILAGLILVLVTSHLFEYSTSTQRTMLQGADHELP